MTTPFMYPEKDYTRDYDILKNYTETAARYLAIRTGKSMEEAIAFVQSKVDNNTGNGLVVRALYRKDNGDRDKIRLTYLDHLKLITQRGDLLAPNGIVYANPDRIKSPVAGFIGHNLKERSRVKKQAQLDKINDNIQAAAFGNRLQGNFKLLNNSVSGAYSSEYNALHYPSMHTTLTSTCRATTSYANAITERLLASNRHYYTLEIALGNVAAIVQRADYKRIKDVIEQYKIAIPTVEYVVLLIKECLGQYQWMESFEHTIQETVQGLTDIERAAFCYTGDLKSLMGLNESLFRSLFDTILNVPTDTSNITEEQADTILSQADHDLLAAVNVMAGEYMVGKSLKKLKSTDINQYKLHAVYMDNVANIFAGLENLIKAFICTHLLPTGIHSFPFGIRRVVIASDTDSCIFTSQEQVKWYMGSYGTKMKHMRIHALITYITSQCVAHGVAVLCGQMGVAKEKLFQLTMKNEFLFPSMIATSRTKHYIAEESVCEGNVYEEPELNIKGVALKSSKLPPDIMDIAKRYYTAALNIPNCVDRFTPRHAMSVPGLLEHLILEQIESGSSSFYRTVQIKQASSYKNPPQSIYLYYSFWNTVFGPKYGNIPTLPASCVKVSVNLDKKYLVEEWASKMEPDMAKRFLQWCHDNGKSTFTQIPVPTEVMAEAGTIPKEIVWVVDRRKILKELVEPFYIVMECLGLFFINKNYTRFVSDEMTKEEALQHLMIDVFDYKAASI